MFFELLGGPSTQLQRKLSCFRNGGCPICPFLFPVLERASRGRWRESEEMCWLLGAASLHSCMSAGTRAALDSRSLHGRTGVTHCPTLLMHPVDFSLAFAVRRRSARHRRSPEDFPFPVVAAEQKRAPNLGHIEGRKPCELAVSAELTQMRSGHVCSAGTLAFPCRQKLEVKTPPPAVSKRLCATQLRTKWGIGHRLVEVFLMSPS